LSEAVPRVTPLLRKETAPVGLPPDPAATVAVRVIVCPAVIELEETPRVVVVAAAGAAFTVSVKGEDVEALKLVLPPYFAVIV
jgi:hypothetical protein